jgi:dihydropteroate synthase
MNLFRSIREKDPNCIISIDTRKSEVAKAAIDAGADIVNDVSGGVFDCEMIPFIAAKKVPYIVMHMRGEPSTMLSKKFSTYENLHEEVTNELIQRLKVLEEHSVPKWLQIIDPGIGFAKDFENNVALLNPQQLKTLKEKCGSLPLLIGLSRKRFFTHLHQQCQQVRNMLILQDDEEICPSSLTDDTIDDSNISNSNSQQKDLSLHDRDLFTAAGCCISLMGGADILRVHNVREIRMMCDTFAIMIAMNQHQSTQPNNC